MLRWERWERWELDIEGEAATARGSMCLGEKVPVQQLEFGDPS